jgi:hypothetical protein
VTADHSGGIACDTCHQPHKPKIETQTEAKAATSTKRATEGKK